MLCRLPSSRIYEPARIWKRILQRLGQKYRIGWYAYPQVVISQPAYSQAYPPVTQLQTPEQEVTALENCQKDLATEKADL